MDGLIRACPGGRRDHWGPSGSFGYVLGVVGVIPGRWVRSGGRWAHSGTFGTFRRVQGVVGFIRGRWVIVGAPLGSLG